jgi:beta-galactosidase
MENQILICPDGRICLKVDASKDPAYDTLPRIGLRLFLKGTMKQVDYYGMGPSETYIDKHHSGSHGFYRDTAAGLMEDYIRPQESGSHYDCDFVSVKGKGTSLTLVSGDDQTFSFSALPYTQEELEEKRHNYELVPCGSTVLCVDHKMAGIGSKSCGPDLPERYRVSEDRFRFAFILKPEKL